jgi:hypothetical protein
MSYLDERRAFIAAGRPLKQKKPYQIKKVSDKRAAKIKEQQQSNSDESLDKFFERMRKRMTGVCQCGGAEKTQKDDDTFYRNCICHIFPKRIFKSIATHELNWVERSFWSGCHTNMDNRSIELWKNFADWDDIKEKFHQLVPLLTDEERASKFYHNLERIVYAI